MTYIIKKVRFGQRLILGGMSLSLLIGLSGCDALERYKAKASASAGSQSGAQANGGKSFKENPDPDKFLAIPEKENTIRVVVSGDGWQGYDRSCTALNDSSSFHSIGMRRASISVDVCDEQNGTHAAFGFARDAEGGLESPGVFDITDGQAVNAGVSIQPPGFPHVNSQLNGKLWVRSAQVSEKDTLFEASYYGKTMWQKSEADQTLVPVNVQVAVKVRLRNIEIPER